MGWFEVACIWSISHTWWQKRRPSGSCAGFGLLKIEQLRSIFGRYKKSSDRPTPPTRTILWTAEEETSSLGTPWVIQKGKNKNWQSLLFSPDYWWKKVCNVFLKKNYYWPIDSGQHIIIFIRYYHVFFSCNVWLLICNIMISPFPRLNFQWSLLRYKDSF